MKVIKVILFILLEKSFRY